MYLGTLSTYADDDGSCEFKTVVSTSGKLLQQQIADSARELGMHGVILMGSAFRTSCGRNAGDVTLDKTPCFFA